ncbi:MAG: pantetheine-phosphate adenylyltransferase [Alphaproteobacteria bacterium]|nr:pantetheine-phosphate adenylyltransferase [Rhodospirillales bacterium]MCW9045195.1 pantetheine-phosphate adenylyltransferase [Alphaproteobacteria bacterium]
MSNRIGVYPGTFDPATNGHLDIIKRATKLVDKLVVAVAINPGKGPLFTLDERVKIVRQEIESQNLGDLVEVRPFDTLLMHFVADLGGHVIIRGLRAVSDFEYEFQMAGMNAQLNSEIETVFLMASDKHQLIASRFVREICMLGGDISKFVSPYVEKKMLEKVSN